MAKPFYTPGNHASESDASLQGWGAVCNGTFLESVGETNAHKLPGIIGRNLSCTKKIAEGPGSSHK